MTSTPLIRPRPRAPVASSPAPKGSSALTAALKASVQAIDSGTENASPLSEVSPEAFDELFDRINTHLAAGLPEAITDGELIAVVQKLRLERHRWQQQQEKEKSTPKKRAARSVAQAIGLGDL